MDRGQWIVVSLSLLLSAAWLGGDIDFLLFEVNNEHHTSVLIS